MNHTQNYSLNQWEKADRLRMDDFNADNAKLDAALAAMPKLTVGTYTGSGKFGSASSATSITLPFVPKLLVVLPASGSYSLISVYGVGQAMTSPTGHTGGSMYMTWDEQTVSWYSAVSSMSDAEFQLNKSGTKYIYFAIG